MRREAEVSPCAPCTQRLGCKQLVLHHLAPRPCSAQWLRPADSLLQSGALPAELRQTRAAAQAHTTERAQLEAQLSASQQELAAAVEERRTAAAKHKHRAKQHQGQLAELQQGVLAAEQSAQQAKQDLEGRCVPFRPRSDLLRSVFAAGGCAGGDVSMASPACACLAAECMCSACLPAAHGGTLAAVRICMTAAAPAQAREQPSSRGRLPQPAGSQ